jgi:exonuclease III
MRLVTWNCNLSLGRKLDLLLQLEPDVAVIQECEEALVVPTGYGFRWRGNNPKKGLGVIVKRQAVVVSPLLQDEWTYFLPLTFPESGIRLLATWAYNHRATRFGPDRIGYPLEVLASMSEWLGEDRALVVGDFNNSVVWDKPNGPRNFGVVEAKLCDLGFRSAYHSHTSEALGSETRSTYFHTKNLAKPFHIDYCFVHSSLNIESVTVPDFAQWRAVSDHVPIIVELGDGDDLKSKKPGPVA